MMRNLVLVKTPKQTKSKGGLELPASAIEEKKMAGSWGIAVAIGKECEEVKKNDQVLPKEWVGNYLDEEGFDSNFWYKVVAEDDLLCIKPTN